MRRRWFVMAVLLLVFAGVAAAQTERMVVPRLRFDDGGFAYAAHDMGYLTFNRAVPSNLMTVALLPEASENALPIHFTPVDPALLEGADNATARALLGIDVSERSIELPFAVAGADAFAVLRYFHERLPALGFAPRQELFGGTSYVYTCSCGMATDTGLRLMLDRTGDTMFVRLVLEFPTVY